METDIETQFELIPYTIENQDNFWVHLGYNVNKLIIDFDIIYGNIGRYNFPKNHRIMNLVFYYLNPCEIIGKFTTKLYLFILNEYKDRSEIIYNDTMRIPTRSFLSGLMRRFNPAYLNYPRLESKRKKKSLTTADFMFIEETFNNLENILDLVSNQDRFKKEFARDEKEFIELKEFEQIINKIHKTIERLRNYITEIPCRII